MLSRWMGRNSATSEQPISEAEQATALRAAVEADITADTNDFVTESCLHRYLRARNHDVNKAQSMLQTTLKWRASYRPDMLVERDLSKLREESATGKMYVMPEADAMGRAVIIMRPGKENSQDSRGKIANLVYTLERAAKTARDAGGQQFVVIVDYVVGKVSASTLPSLSVTRETTNILQHHYPERLACMVLIQAPRLFHSMFKIIRPVIDVKTREKIHFVNNMEEAVSVPGIDANVIPTEYGGKLDWTFEVDKYFEKDSTANSNVHKE